MGTDLEKARNTVAKLRSELVAIEQKIAHSVEVHDKAHADAIAFLAQAARGRQPGPKTKLASLKGVQAQALQDREGLAAAKLEIERELAVAEAEQERHERQKRSEEFKADAEMIRGRGADLAAAINGMLDAVRDIRTALASVRNKGGHAPVGELVDVGLLDLFRTAFAPLHWLRLDQPNRRWSATELVNSWASSIEGGTAKLVTETAPTAKAKAPAIDPADPRLDVGLGQFAVYGDKAAADAALAKMREGPSK